MFKNIFPIDTNVKMWKEIIDLVVLGRNYWSSCRVRTEGSGAKPWDVGEHILFANILAEN